MPYAAVKDLPAAVKSKIKDKTRRRQWLEVFNSAYAKHGDEGRAFAEAWAATEKSGGVSKRLKIGKEAAGYKKQTIDAQRCAVCTMFLLPDACTLVKGKILPQGWCKFFKPKKPSALAKAGATMTGELKLFLPLQKVEKKTDGTCVVSGYASTPTKDLDGEVVSLDAVKKALPGYMAWGNVREMHRLSAVGRAQDAKVDSNGLWLRAKITDPTAVQKCLDKVYQGFSIGGRKLDKVDDTITEIELTEISIVDRPANPDCRLSIAKSAKKMGTEDGGHLMKMPADNAEAAAGVAKAAKALAKALRKAGPPAAHDGFSLPAPGANKSPKDQDNQNNKASPPATEIDKGGDVPGDGSKPYGDVKYADPGYQADKKKRYPIDTEDHIRAAWNYIHKPKNAKKYTPEQAGHIRSAIVAAWKDVIGKEGPPEAKGKKAKKLAKWFRKAEASRALGAMELRKADAPRVPDEGFLNLDLPEPTEPEQTEFIFDLPSEETPSVEIDSETGLAKSMGAARDLACAFDTLRNVQRSLMLEAKREGGDMKDKGLAKRIGAIAKDLAAIIGQKAEHEGGEALDLSDADDRWVNQSLGEDIAMTETTDGLEKAIINIIKRSAEPTRAQRIVKAAENLQAARKARKSALKAIEKAHEMHKAAYLSKAAKKNGKGEGEGEADFDHAGAMEKLQKAYGELSKMGTFMKAAKEQLEKAAKGRAGEKGQETGDAVSGVYEVPAGVKDLSTGDLATASPGGSARGSAPPIYPGDGSVYPGKAAVAETLKKFAKNGQISADLVELIVQNAQTEGELAALKRLPAVAANGGRKPYAFDLTKVMGDGSATATPEIREKRAALFDGVDPGELASSDEQVHNAGVAKVIGNLLTSGHFGQSIFAQNFRGAAGGRS